MGACVVGPAVIVIVGEIDIVGTCVVGEFVITDETYGHRNTVVVSDSLLLPPLSSPSLSSATTGTVISNRSGYNSIISSTCSLFILSLLATASVADVSVSVVVI